jgi:hypothetical protein
VELLLFLSRKPYLLDRGFAALPGFLRRRIWPSRLGPGLHLQVHWRVNCCPYCKLLPLLERLTPEQERLDPLLITADNETLYPRDWLRRLVAAQERWGCVVAYRDWRLNDERLLQPSLLTLPTGKDGIWFKTHTLLTATPNRLLHHNMSQQFVELSSQGWHSGAGCTAIQAARRSSSRSSSSAVTIRCWPIAGAICRNS